MVDIPPIYGDDWGMVYDSFTHIRLSSFFRYVKPIITYPIYGYKNPWFPMLSLDAFPWGLSPCTCSAAQCWAVGCTWWCPVSFLPWRIQTRRPCREPVISIRKKNGKFGVVQLRSYRDVVVFNGNLRNNIGFFGSEMAGFLMFLGSLKTPWLVLHMFQY